MKQPRAVLYGIGVFIICAGIIIGFRHDHALAALTGLGTDALESWSWIGMPVDQAGSTVGISPESAYGFIHLNCLSDASCDPVTGDDTDPLTGLVEDPYVAVDFDNCTNGLCEVDGWAWMGTGDADVPGTEESIGWLNFDPAPLPSSTYADPACIALGPAYYYPAEPCYSAKIDETNQEELSGWARFETLAEHGGGVLFGAPSIVDGDWGWVLLRGNVDPSAGGAEYGVLYRNDTLEGWAYSGGGTVDPIGLAYDNSVGLGWLDFSSGVTGTVTGTGYVSTERGDVYVHGGINNTVDPTTLTPTQYNATFLILSSDSNPIVNFNSEYADGLGGADGIFTEEDFETMQLPTDDQLYRSELGRIDMDKLTTVVSGTENVYGETVQSISSLSTLSGNLFLDGTVYETSGGTISNAITFISGTSSDPSSGAFDASGTIIVDGDLRIEANTFYETGTALLHLANLPSIAWVVLGDVTIAENVTNVVGSFFIFGDASTDDGRLITEAPGSAQLQLFGLTMAYGFDLQRTYEGVPGVNEAAELFYYDGRIIANTPPGLRDYASVLPLIESEE